MDSDELGSKPKDLLGTTFDLKSAHKQFGVDLAHAEKLRIAVKKPKGRGRQLQSFSVALWCHGKRGRVPENFICDSLCGNPRACPFHGQYSLMTTLLSPDGLEADTTICAGGFLCCVLCLCRGWGSSFCFVFGSCRLERCQSTSGMPRSFWQAFSKSLVAVSISSPVTWHRVSWPIDSAMRCSAACSISDMFAGAGCANWKAGIPVDDGQWTA